jgi:putative hemin transport protein
MNLETTLDANDLVSRWAQLHGREPHLRQRDGAAKLGVTEARLVAAHVGTTAVRLSDDWKGILQGLGTVGPVTSLTRNDHAVIEKVGSYSRVEIEGPMGQVLDEGVDLRLFLARWHLAFALREETKRGVRQSLQFFDAAGTAIHKVFLRDESNTKAFETLVRAQRHADQVPRQPLERPQVAPEQRPDDTIDVSALKAAWEKMEDTHEFFHLLRRFGATRIQAFRLVGREWAERVEAGGYRKVLEQAAASGFPIMVFVGNRGIIQIHSGPIHTIKAVHGWYNVLDPDFNLHVYEEGVADAWVVRKPTRDGVVTSLELYDASGETIAYLFSKRKPAQIESTAWRDLLHGLEKSTGNALR